MNRFVYCSFILLLTFCASILAQEKTRRTGITQTQPTVFLRVEAIAKSDLSSPINEGSARCDARGNIYIRPIVDTGKPQLDMRVPTAEVGRDGERVTSFDVTAASPDFHFPGSSSFFVTADGRVYAAVWDNRAVVKGNRAHIVQFTRNGSVASVTQVATDESFTPNHIAIFKSGEILLTGTEGDLGHRPFTAIFNYKGELIKKIYEPEDEQLRIRADTGDSEVLSDSSNSGNAAVLDGGAVSASDGNVYVMRSTSPAILYDISPRGEVVRKLQVDSEDQRMRAFDLQSSGDRLAILFRGWWAGHSKAALKVVDLEGNPIAGYRSEDGIPWGSLACFAPFGVYLPR
jgi:hypothetical protein